MFACACVHVCARVHVHDWVSACEHLPRIANVRNAGAVRCKWSAAGHARLDAFVRLDVLAPAAVKGCSAAVIGCAAAEEECTCLAAPAAAAVTVCVCVFVCLCVCECE